MGARVLTQVDCDGNARVILNRPKAHNAFDPEMVTELTTRLSELDADPGVRTVVLVGAGRSFCAGADIAHMKKSANFNSEENFRDAQRSARMFHALNTLAKPTIAGVRGAVRGGGVGLVAACDMAIAARGATFRLSEVKLGIIPAMISPYVIGAIGERMARRYMLSGEEFDAVEAARIGLVHDVVAEQDLEAAIERLLAQLKSSGPMALAAIKALVAKRGRGRIDDAIIDETAREIAAIRATPEAQEGLAAFLEKRAPAWAKPSAPPAISSARRSAGPRNPGRRAPSGRRPRDGGR
jgi:methylglutaconyl-CoA hydratase